MSPLQELRGTHGLSAAQFAAALGITYSQLYQAEHGLQQVPRKAWEALSEMGGCGPIEVQASAMSPADGHRNQTNGGTNGDCEAGKQTG